MQVTTFLDACGVRWRWGNGRQQLQACCPFCRESRYRLGINLEKRAANCFNGGCNWHGTLFRFTKELRGEAVRLEGLGGGRTSEEVRIIDLPEEFAPLAGVEPDEFGLGALVAYITTRGVEAHDFARYHIGGCVSGRFTDRVIFPVFYGTHLYTYLGRTIHKGVEPRYKNAYKATRAVWGLEPATEHESGWLVLSEGVLKALAMQRVVAGCNAASLGNQLSEFQFDQIEEAGYKHVVVIPDPGIAGLEGLKKTGDELLGRGIEMYYPRPLPVKQADEATPEERRRWVDNIEQYTRITRLKIMRELAA